MGSNPNTAYWMHICCKNWIACFKRPKIMKKMPAMDHFLTFGHETFNFVVLFFSSFTTWRMCDAGNDIFGRSVLSNLFPLKCVPPYNLGANEPSLFPRLETAWKTGEKDWGRILPWTNWPWLEVWGCFIKSWNCRIFTVSKTSRKWFYKLIFLGHFLLILTDPTIGKSVKVLKKYFLRPVKWTNR